MLSIFPWEGSLEETISSVRGLENSICEARWVSGLFVPKNRLSKNTGQVHIQGSHLGSQRPAFCLQKSSYLPCCCDWQKRTCSHEDWNPPATQRPPLPCNFSLVPPFYNPDNPSSAASESMDLGPEFSSRCTIPFISNVTTMIQTLAPSP